MSKRILNIALSNIDGDNKLYDWIKENTMLLSEHNLLVSRKVAKKIGRYFEYKNIHVVESEYNTYFQGLHAKIESKEVDLVVRITNDAYNYVVENLKIEEKCESWGIPFTSSRVSAVKLVTLMRNESLFNDKSFDYYDYKSYL